MRPKWAIRQDGTGAGYWPVFEASGPVLNFIMTRFENRGSFERTLKVGKLVRRTRRPMTDQQFAAVLLHLRILIVLLGSVGSILVAFAWKYLWRETKPATPPVHRPEILSALYCG